MALTKSLKFNKIDETFKNCGNLVKDGPDPNKKPKMDNAGESSKQPDEEKSEEYQSSYILTMSQQVTEGDGDVTFSDDVRNSYLCNQYYQTKTIFK